MGDREASPGADPHPGPLPSRERERPADALRRELLAARDARQAALDGLAGAGWPTLVAVSLAVPGPVKVPAGAPELFAWALSALAEALPEARPLHRSDDALGPFAVLGTRREAGEVKRRCVAIEEGRAAARLLDLDVLSPCGPVDRAALGLPPRACLCCGAPARECIRAGRHGAAALVERARALVDDGPGRLAAGLAEGLRRELHLTPKPGLVDRDDAGSHPDLSLALMERSIALVAASHRRLAASLGRGEPLAVQVRLGREAEAEAEASLGTNAHKGAAFLGGLLLVARHRAATDDEAAVRAAAAGAARELALLRAREAPGTAGDSHGASARRRYGVGGVLGEAAAGLPSLFAAALPAFRDALRRRGCAELASFAMLARLMQVVEDTTALHRCGPPGLATLREDGARLERLLASAGGAGGEGGGGHVAFLRERNGAYRARGLTMGGVADLLGLGLGWLRFRGELAPLDGAAAGHKMGSR